MEEQLISFETAKLANEKGFTLTKYLKINIDNPLNLNSNCNPAEYQPCFFNINQSLLQKWLREKHNIDVIPICNYRYNKGRLYNLGIIFINKDNKVDTIIIQETDKSLDTIHRYYNTYEEALEQGLIEALKLIM